MITEEVAKLGLLSDRHTRGAPDSPPTGRQEMAWVSGVAGLSCRSAWPVDPPAPPVAGFHRRLADRSAAQVRGTQAPRRQFSIRRVSDVAST